MGSYAGNPPPPAHEEVDPLVIAMLIKSTIIALQHANQTGNYTVLQDLGTPVFRERFDSAKLASVFANLRARGINLSPSLMLMPVLEKPAEFTPQNQLHLVGNFPTRPLEIKYELLFLKLDGIWRLDGIGVNAVPAQENPQASADANAKAAAAQQADAKKAKAKK